MPGVRPHSTCASCGKQAFSSRKHARAFARRVFPGAAMRAYRCPGVPGNWHVSSESALTAAAFKDYLSTRQGTRRQPEGPLPE